MKTTLAMVFLIMAIVFGWARRKYKKTTKVKGSDLNMTNQRYKDFYENNWNENYGFWHKITNRGQQQIDLLAEILNDFKKNAIAILDLGCGEGDELAAAIKQISDKKFNIIANDTSREALNLYRKNNKRHLKTTALEDLIRLPEKIEGKFDLILFSHCLYGVNLQGLLQKYIPLLEEDGQIVIFLDSRINEFKKIQIWFWEEVYGHPFDENVAESIAREINKSERSLGKIYYEEYFFDYTIDLKKLKRISNDGIWKLFIPFIMRNSDLDLSIKKEINSFINKIATNGKLKGRAVLMKLNRSYKK